MYWATVTASEVKCGSYLTVQREASQQLRTIITSAVNNTPPRGGCAEKCITVAEDNGTMSPNAGRKQWFNAGRQGNAPVLLHPGGWQGVFRSHVIRLQSLHGLAFAGLHCAIQMWDIQKEFETPPRCLLKAVCAARTSLWLAMLLTSVAVWLACRVKVQKCRKGEGAGRAPR